MISPKVVSRLASEIIGQPIPNAQKICHRHGLEFRVTHIDGVMIEPYCDPSVLNVRTEEGIVKEIENK